MIRWCWCAPPLSQSLPASNVKKADFEAKQSAVASLPWAKQPTTGVELVWQVSLSLLSLASTHAVLTNTLGTT